MCSRPELVRSCWPKWVVAKVCLAKVGLAKVGHSHLFVPLLSGLQQFISFPHNPGTTRALPTPHKRLAIWTHSSHPVVSSQMRFLPHLFNLRLESFPSYLGPSHFPSSFIFLLLSFRTSCNDIDLWPHTTPCDAFLVPFVLSTKTNFSLCFCSSSSQSCHSSTRQRKPAAARNAEQTSSFFAGLCLP